MSKIELQRTVAHIKVFFVFSGSFANPKTNFCSCRKLCSFGERQANHVSCRNALSFLTGDRDFCFGSNSILFKVHKAREILLFSYKILSSVEVKS